MTPLALSVGTGRNGWVRLLPHLAQLRKPSGGQASDQACYRAQRRPATYLHPTPSWLT